MVFASAKSHRQISHVAKGHFGSTTEIQLKVPLSRPVSLNKPEIPVLRLGSIASNDLIFPIFAIVFSNVIKEFYKLPQIMKNDAEFRSSMLIGCGKAYLLPFPVGSYFF
jgi:ATP-binding cassette subfamily B (MDR/TAP) protein 1